MTDVDALAQEIRRVDGSNSLGAGQLAEALAPFINHTLASSEAARIKAEGEVERLREVMEPFARIADEIFRCGMNKSRQDDAGVWGFDRETMTYGDLRAARAALRREPSTALEPGKTEGGGE